MTVNKAKYSCSSPESLLLCRMLWLQTSQRQGFEQDDVARKRRGSVWDRPWSWPLVHLTLACKSKGGFSGPHLLPPGPGTAQDVTGLPTVNVGRTDLASHTNDVSFGLYLLVLKLIH